MGLRNGNGNFPLVLSAGRTWVYRECFASDVALARFLTARYDTDFAVIRYISGMHCRLHCHFFSGWTGCVLRLFILFNSYFYYARDAIIWQDVLC